MRNVAIIPGNHLPVKKCFSGFLQLLLAPM